MRQDRISVLFVAEERLAPSGYIGVHGKLWQSEVVGKKAPIEKGETVLVTKGPD